MTGVAAGDDAARHELIGRIHATETCGVLAVTGGGMASLAWLLTVPGASRTVLEATIPYAESALADLVGHAPDQAVSAATAAAMAAACLQRAARLDPDGTGRHAGVAATAALVSDRPKRGEHRAHVACAVPGGTQVWSLTLAKGRRDRAGEDRLVSDLVVAVLAEACGLDPGPLPGLLDEDRLEEPARPDR
jgi:nicotinamide mononucleotide (NMN) deamidase PncC